MATVADFGQDDAEWGALLLASIAPDEFVSLSRTFYENGDRKNINDEPIIKAEAVIRLIRKVKKAAKDPNPSDGIEYAYLTAWIYATDLQSMLKNDEARQQIQNEWDSSLEQGGDLVIAQLQALRLCPDRRLLTETVWKALEKSLSDRRVASVICYVLLRHGDENDLKRLRVLYDTMPNDIATKKMVRDCCKYLGKRLKGELTLTYPIPQFFD